MQRHLNTYIMQKLTIRGIKFEVDDQGFTHGPSGPLGHIEECEMAAEFFQALFDVVDHIDLNQSKI